MDLPSIWDVILLLALGVWALAFRSFPGIISKGVLQRMEHSHKAKRAAVQDEYETSREAMGASIAFLAAAQSETRSRAIVSVESLWRSLDTMEDEFIYPISMDVQLTRQEREVFLSGGNVGESWEIARKEYKEKYAVSSRRAKIVEGRTGTEILHVGAKLWGIYECIFIIHVTWATMFAESIQTGRYAHWRDNRVINYQAGRYAPADVLKAAREAERMGLSSITDWLRAEFIKEAVQTIRGTKEVRQSVRDIYNVLRDAADQRAAAS